MSTIPVEGVQNDSTRPGAAVPAGPGGATDR